MRLRFWIGLAAVALIAAGSVAIALVVHADNNSDFHRTQEDEALRAAHQTEAVASLSVGELSSAAAFFKADGNLNQHEFEVVAHALMRQGVLHAAAYLPAVRSSERAAYEREHGFPITEPGPAGPRRAERRAVYVPLTYVAAEGATGRALGSNLGADPNRGPYLREARDTGRVVATPVIRLLLGGFGINVYRAVYRDGAPTATVAERRAALVGFAAGSVMVRDLARAAAAVLPGPSVEQIRVRHRRVAGVTGQLEDPSTAPIHIADQTWLLVVRDPDRPDVSLPILLGAVGLALAALLAALILFWSRNERIEELERQAGEDALTGLANRRRFEEDLWTAMARSRRDGSTGALLMLDLDDFKQVNDTRGHPAGDRLIKEVAEVLQRRTRASDSLARLGGDEFAVILPRCSREEARLVADAMVDAIRAHGADSDGLGPITASVGVAMFGEDPRTSPTTVISEADTAMYAAKDGGRNGIRVFDPGAVRAKDG
jgi:diguanylate cyclase (GGDEF)-like protein